MHAYKSECFKGDALPYVEVWHISHTAINHKPHFHYMLSIGAVEEGEVDILHDGQITHLSAGELIIFNPETVHTFNPTKDAELKYHMICLDITWCKAFQESMWGISLDAFEKINRSVFRDKMMHESFIMLSVLLRDQSVFVLEKEEALHQFMKAFFDRNTSHLTSHHASDKLILDHLESVKDYIKENVRENITVAQLAKKASLSDYHFMRVFKHYVGMSPYAYLINQKINLAQRLLLDGTPIIEVALELGFVDQSHLNRHFRPIVTMSPGKFVQEARIC